MARVAAEGQDSRGRQGFVKGWFAMMQNHILVMKELERMQLMMLDRSGD